MIVRGIYEIQQMDRIMREEQIRAKAQEMIAAQIRDAVISQTNPSIIKEEPSPKYPFGRYYLDLNVEVAQ